MMDILEATPESGTGFQPVRSSALAALKASAQRRVKNLSHFLSPLLDTSRAAASIFLCSSWKTGALLCASLLLVPRYFLFAMSATLLGGMIAKLMHLPAAMRKDGTLLYNVLLSALAVAWITRNTTLPPAAIYGMLGVATVYSLLLSAALWHWFPLKAGLPPLSVAFVVVFGTLLTFFPLAAAASAALPYALPADPALPFAVNAFLRSLGTILFMPNVWAGVAVLVALLVWSRVAIVNAIAGYAGGILVVKMLEACGLQWFGWFAGHNYLLAGMALGAVYFVPSWSSLALAFGGGAVAALNVAAVPCVCGKNPVRCCPPSTPLKIPRQQPRPSRSRMHASRIATRRMCCSRPHARSPSRKVSTISSAIAAIGSTRSTLKCWMPQETPARPAATTISPATTPRASKSVLPAAVKSSASSTACPTTPPAAATSRRTGATTSSSVSITAAS
jgi:urea transporter